MSTTASDLGASDLPFALTQSPGRSAGPVVSPRIPWWMRPAFLAGRWRPALRRSVLADAGASPARRRWVGIAALIGVAVDIVSSALHAVAPAGQPGWDFNTFGLFVHNLYSESVTFLLVAVVIGYLSPSAGALMVMALVPMDLAAAFAQDWELTPILTAPLGRLVGYAVLWALVVEAPLLARSMAEDYVSKDWSRRLMLLAGSVVTAELWVLAAPILLRPPFVWSDLFEPSYQAIESSQRYGWLLVTGALLGAVLTRFWLHDRSAPLLRPVPAEEVSRLGGWPRRIIVGIGGVVFLGGLVTSPIDVALLAGILIGNAWLSDRASAGGKTPTPLALVLGAAAGFLVAARIGSALYRVRPTEFFGIIVGIGSALLIAHLVASIPVLRIGSKTTMVLLVVGGAAVLTLLFTGTALADNCSGQNDCFATAGAAGATAGGLGAAAAIAKRKEALKRSTRPPDPVGGAAEMAARKDALRKASQPPPPGFKVPDWTGPPPFWKQPGWKPDYSGLRPGGKPFRSCAFKPEGCPAPKNHDKPIDPRATTSSGAGIKA